MDQSRTVHNAAANKNGGSPLWHEIVVVHKDNATDIGRNKVRDRRVTEYWMVKFARLEHL